MQDGDQAQCTRHGRECMQWRMCNKCKAGIPAGIMHGMDCSIYDRVCAEYVCDDPVHSNTRCHRCACYVARADTTNRFGPPGRLYCRECWARMKADARTPDAIALATALASDTDPILDGLVLEMKVDGDPGRQRFHVTPNASTSHIHKGFKFSVSFDNNRTATLRVTSVDDGWSPGPDMVVPLGVRIPARIMRSGSNVRLGCYWQSGGLM